MNRSFGGVLVADAMRTLAECLQAGGDGADAAETLHADADTAYAAVGARHMLRSAPRFEATAIVANELRREGDT